MARFQKADTSSSTGRGLLFMQQLPSRDALWRLQRRYAYQHAIASLVAQNKKSTPQDKKRSVEENITRNVEGVKQAIGEMTRGIGINNGALFKSQGINRLGAK